MENIETSSFSSKIQLLLDSQVEFPQKLKQHLVFKSDQVSNPFKFIGGLLSKKVLCDGSNDSEANFGLKEMMVQLAMMMACAEGAEGIGGLLEALEESGNPQLVSDFRAWIKQDFGTEIESNFGEPKEENSAAHNERPGVLAAQTGNVNETSSCGAKLVDKIMSRLEDDFMGQLEGHLVSKAAEIVNIPEFCSSLVHQKVLDENELRLATGPEIQDQKQIQKVIQAACLKRAMWSIVVALQNSNNELILAGTYEWLETSQARKKNYPISLKSLGRQPRATAAITGLFAATDAGLISLDLQTFHAISLTNELSYAVAVNQNLKKVYWSEGDKSRIMRSNFDGSAKEEIVPQTGGPIFMLAIDEPSGNVYFAPYNSIEITICNAIGQNRAAVISDSSLVHCPFAIALDSENGALYWSFEGSPGCLLRANLDGSKATMISTGFSDLSGITLDRSSNGILYWADYLENTVGTIDVHGGNKRTLVKLEGDPGPYGIQVDAHKIYLGNLRGNKIQSVDKGSGKELTTIFNTNGNVRQLTLFNVLA